MTDLLPKNLENLDEHTNDPKITIYADAVQSVLMKCDQTDDADALYNSSFVDNSFDIKTKVSRDLMEAAKEYADINNFVNRSESRRLSPIGHKKVYSKKSASSESQKQRNFNDSSLSIYLDSLSGYDLLDATEEYELGQKIRMAKFATAKLALDGIMACCGLPPMFEEGEKDISIIQSGLRAKERFILSNLRLVVSVAKRINGNPSNKSPLEDLTQDGNIGLERAVDLFDERKGWKFSTYATWWITQSMTRASSDTGNTIRLPNHVVEKITAIEHRSKELALELQREPTIQEVANSTGVAPEKIEELTLISRGVVSLDAHLSDGDSRTIIDFVADTDAQEDFVKIEINERNKSIRRFISSELTEKEENVIIQRFGLDGSRPKTLAEVGEVLNLTRERIRQIEKQALGKLRNSPSLEEYLDYSDYSA